MRIDQWRIKGALRNAPFGQKKILAIEKGRKTEAQNSKFLVYNECAIKCTMNTQKNMAYVNANINIT